MKSNGHQGRIFTAYVKGEYAAMEGKDQDAVPYPSNGVRLGPKNVTEREAWLRGWFVGDQIMRRRAKRTKRANSPVGSKQK